MNKEQLLGRLLMNGHINMDELIILNKIEPLKKEKSIYTTDTTESKIGNESNEFSWLDEFKNNNPDFTLTIVNTSTSLQNG